jgi:acyl-CoA thioesterase FadM
MNLIFRLIRTVLLAFHGRRIDPMAGSVLHFRVLPLDMDPNIHLNNGRYLAFMDLGRLDLIIRAGFYRFLLRERWGLVMGGCLMRYRRQLGPFQRFRLVTRLVGWDEKWLFVEHRFESRHGLHAIGHTKLVLMEGGSSLPMPRALERLGYAQPSPPLPDGIRHWLEAERELTAGGGQ